MQWVSWATKVVAYNAMGNENPANIIVPTVDIVRLNYVIHLNILGNKPSMFVGPAGTGKTTFVRDYLAALNSEEYLYTNINFNSNTDSRSLQKVMENNVEKRMGRTYGPPTNKYQIFFIDDLNMPAVDVYGT